MISREDIITIVEMNYGELQHTTAIGPYSKRPIKCRIKYGCKLYEDGFRLPVIVYAPYNFDPYNVRDTSYVSEANVHEWEPTKEMHRWIRLHRLFKLAGLYRITPLWILADKLDDMDFNEDAQWVRKTYPVTVPRARRKKKQ